MTTNPFFENYRFMAREEIRAARLLKKHGLLDCAKTCVANARVFRKASFQFVRKETRLPTPPRG